MSRVLITGAAGQTSISLIKQLISEGYEPIATDIKEKPELLEELGTPYIRADLTKTKELEGIIEYAPYDGVIHTAAIVAPLVRIIHHYEVNTRGSQNLFTLLSKEGVLSENAKVINTATASEYNSFRIVKNFFGWKKEYHPVPVEGADEDEQPIGWMGGPFKSYCESKLWQELLGHEFNGKEEEEIKQMLSDPRYYDKYKEYVGPIENSELPIITIRPGLVYSPHVTELTGDLLNMVACGFGRSLSCLMPDFPTGFVSADNVASIEKFLLEQDNDEVVGQVYNAADDAPIGFAELSELVGEALDKPYKSEIPDSVKMQELIMYSKLFNSNKMKFMIKIAMDGLHIPVLLVLTDILGNHHFSINKLKDLGWKPEGNVVEEIGDVAREMYEEGRIGGYTPGQERINDMIGQFLNQFVTTKYIDDKELAVKNKKVGCRRKYKKIHTKYVAQLNAWKEHKKR